LSRSPNPEQLLAINHTGGVLLKAGAGSGKTFVLVEHIYYLCGTWIEFFKKKSFGSFEDHIRLHFSQVVMMTFTKKAAGEMSIRLAEKFQQLALEESEDQSYWIIINDHLPLLLVTTIDGFCRKLITSGYFPHLSNEAKIIFGMDTFILIWCLCI
jgi:ATP-dependent exoDNAse (exonuclease V) beta subunit